MSNVSAWQRIGRFLRFWLGMSVEPAEETLPPEARLQDDLVEMGASLDALAQAASYASSRLEEKREDLQVEIQNHDLLGKQAEELLRAGDEEGARRCLVLQTESAERVESLSAAFQLIQREAEEKELRFREFEEGFRQRRDQLAELVEDIRSVREMEAIEEQLSALQLGGAQERFDEVTASVKRRKLEQEARHLLDHPDAEAERRMQEILEAGKIDSAMQALQARVAGGLPSGASEDPIAEAREVLGHPPKRLSPGDLEGNGPLSNREGPASEEEEEPRESPQE